MDFLIALLVLGIMILINLIATIWAMRSLKSSTRSINWRVS